MADHTIELIRCAFEAHSLQTSTITMDDGTAEIVVLIRGPVPIGCRIAFFHVMNGTGDLHAVEACVYIAHGVTEPELPLYEALNAVNFELTTDFGVRAYLDLDEADVMLSCRIPPLASDEDVGRMCLRVLRDFETALEVCGRYPMLFAYSNETNPLGTGGVKSPLTGADEEWLVPRAERRRQPRRYFRTHGRCGAFRESAHRQRILEFLARILQLPRIDLPEDDEKP